MKRLILLFSIVLRSKKFSKTTSYYDEPDIEVFDINDLEDNNEKDSER